MDCRAWGWMFLLVALPALGAESPVPEGITCPEPRMAQARYPIEALRARRQGDVIVEVRTDDCCRVLEARVKTASRHADLNASAMEAASRSILSLEDRMKDMEGWNELSFGYSVSASRSVRCKPVDWPRTHRRARYVLDESLDQSISVPAYSQRMRDMEEGAIRPPVVDARHSFRQVQGPDGVEFWLFLSDDDGFQRVAARYRLVMEGAEPMVRVGIRCELDAAQCGSFRKTLLTSGLPMARVRR